MTKRPLSITIVGILAIAIGAMGVAYHASEFDMRRPFETIGLCFVRLLAVLAGAYMLRGRNWARWLWLAWMAFHVAVSFLHSVSEVLMHALFLAVFAYLLFRPPASAYFRAAGAATGAPPTPDDKGKEIQSKINT
jgi:hypothetical protein